MNHYRHILVILNDQNIFYWVPKAALPVLTLWTFGSATACGNNEWINILAAVLSNVAKKSTNIKVFFSVGREIELISWLLY